MDLSSLESTFGEFIHDFKGKKFIKTIFCVEILYFFTETMLPPCVTTTHVTVSLSTKHQIQRFVVNLRFF